MYIQAYDNRIMHPTHVVITYRWYRNHWWRDESVNVSCTVEQRELVLNNSLAINFIVSDLIKDLNSTTMGIVSALIGLGLVYVQH